MIAFLLGEVFQRGPGYAELDVHGVGYRVWMPESAVTQLAAGQTVRVFTHHHVREDATQLYGFLAERDRDWFELLISVSGIGPKVALQMMSATTVDQFVRAVAAADEAWLCSLPGVGKKTAGRLLVELKDKLASVSAQWPVVDAEAQAPSAVSAASGLAGAGLGAMAADVAAALAVLGYPERQAAEVVRLVWQEEPPKSVEAGLKAALRHLVR